MLREGVAVREVPGETGVAMNGLRGKVSGPIEGDQQLIPQDAKGVQHLVLCKAREDLKEHRLQVARRERIEQGADLIVTRHLCHAQQGLGVVATLGVLQPALVL